MNVLVKEMCRTLPILWQLIHDEASQEKTDEIQFIEIYWNIKINDTRQGNINSIHRNGFSWATCSAVVNTKVFYSYDVQYTLTLWKMNVIKITVYSVRLSLIENEALMK